MSQIQPTPNQPSQVQQPAPLLPTTSQPSATPPLPSDPYSPAALILATGVLVAAIGKTESQPTPNLGGQPQQPVQVLPTAGQPPTSSPLPDLYSPTAIILAASVLVAAIGHALSKLNKSY
jgi:hypothetical protein